MSSGNVRCGGCDGIPGCRHNQPETLSNGLESTQLGDAVTRATCDKISAESGRIVVHLPAGPPVLTPRAARTLLAMLVELTEVPVLDRPGEEAGDDC
jgi:hypothetical protein